MVVKSKLDVNMLYITDFFYNSHYVKDQLTL